MLLDFREVLPHDGGGTVVPVTRLERPARRVFPLSKAAWLMPAVHDDQTGRLDRIDNELAVARGLREIAWLNRDDAYEHYELVIEGLVLLRADAERLPTVRDIIDRGGVLP